MEIKLPTEKTPARKELSSFSMLIHGKPKIGKSTFCSEAPNALFLATEPGLNALNVHQMTVTSWAELTHIFAEISKGGHSFETIIIDTIDNAYKMCADRMCTKHDVEHESDLGWGKGPTLINNEFQRVLTSFANSKYGLYMTSHSQEKEYETRTGKYTKVIPTLPDKANKIITGLVDIILYCDLEERKDEEDKASYVRVVRTTVNRYFLAGNRIELPSTIDLKFESFLKSFNEVMEKKGGKSEIP